MPRIRPAIAASSAGWSSRCSCRSCTSGSWSLSSTTAGELKPCSEMLAGLEYGAQQLTIPFLEVSRRGAVAGAKGPRTLSATVEVSGYLLGEEAAKPAEAEAGEGELETPPGAAEAENPPAEGAGAPPPGEPRAVPPPGEPP